MQSEVPVPSPGTKLAAPAKTFKPAEKNFP